MAYMDYNGMVREGLNPNANPGPGGASPWSPWGAAMPNAYETGFEPRNYKPHPTPTNQLSTPQKPAGPALQPLPPLNLPNLAGNPQSGQSAGTGGGMATYRSGIEHGALSNDAISQARSRLQPTAPMPVPNAVPMNAQQQGDIAQQYGDLMRQGTQAADTALTRDAAYQQAQMQLAKDKAMAGAAVSGFGNLVNLDAMNTQNGLQNQQLNNQRQGMLLRALGGLL